MIKMWKRRIGKRALAVVCAVALALSLPVLAWGAPSPSNDQATSGDVVLDVSAGSGTIVSVEASSTEASNVQLADGDEVLASFEVIGDATDVTLTFNVGTQWAGYTCKVFIQHNDNSTEVKTATVDANGTISIHVDELSLFTLVIDTTSAPSGGTGGTDTSSTSPETGVDANSATGVVAGLTIVMALAAVFVAVVLRRKVVR